MVNDEGLRSPKAIAIILPENNPPSSRQVNRRYSLIRCNPSRRIEFFDKNCALEARPHVIRKLKNEA